MPNIRTKGASGEREVIKILNECVDEVRAYNDKCLFDDKDQPFQRNQNQTAVGGSDISNPFDLEIEVKRQENLQINTWWKQTVASAERTGGIPILIYRQSRKPWKVLMLVDINQGKFNNRLVRAEISLEEFLEWFKGHYHCLLQLGDAR